MRLARCCPVLLFTDYCMRRARPVWVRLVTKEDQNQLDRVFVAAKMSPQCRSTDSTTSLSPVDASSACMQARRP